MTLVDTNVLFDLITADPVWVDWSKLALGRAATAGPVFINDVIYAELSVRFSTIELVDEFVRGSGLERLPLAPPSLFLAGKAFARYRALDGVRTGVLPDFFIGAQAAVLEIPLLTRDPSRYRTYFPTVILIAPPTI
ncbi:MAG: type II toxin-antitoxin system VapC family toxin [Rhizobiaceae bacterium]|nr:type II toxin-antitoxin system VapC family toxin [Rhizobiaceae bacterium]